MDLQCALVNTCPLSSTADSVLIIVFHYHMESPLKDQFAIVQLS